MTVADRSPVEMRTTGVRGWWGLVLGAGLLGVVGTIWQTVERFASLSGERSSVCDINTVISCGSVYDHWQSSALGVPNSLIGLPVFAVLVSAALGALLGSRPSGRYLVVLLGVALFMTVFAFWYMHQSAFSIGALCLFCTASMLNIVLAGVGLVRVVDAEGALGEGATARRVHGLVEDGTDLLIWFVLVLAVGGMLFVGLAW